MENSEIKSWKVVKASQGISIIIWQKFRQYEQRDSEFIK